MPVNPDEARKWAKSHGLILRYSANLPRLAAMSAPFVRLDCDEGFASYVHGARNHRHSWLTTRLHRALRAFLSDFDINGYLGTYPMHVLSTEQWRQLLPTSDTTSIGSNEGKQSRADHPTVLDHLLDVGSGRGDVLSSLATLFDRVTTTETSRGMARRLRKQGYEVIERDIAAGLPDRRFDAVSLLNVLDRCDRPLSLLATARTVLRPGGLLIVALVLPYSPFVYENGRSRAPMERLPISSPEFEDATSEFVSLALLSLGFEVIALSRCPYLSGGDADRPIYELDDLIVVCRAKGAPPPIISP